MSNNNNLRVRRRLYVPANLGKYELNVKRINNQGNRMNNNSRYTNIPEEIGTFTQLEILDMRSHNLTSIPKEIGKLKNLKVLYLGHNKLTSLPESIGNLTKLEELHLSYNNLESIPSSIGKLKKLRKLYLQNNKLTSLPRGIEDLASLRYLGLKSNPGLKGISSELEKSGLNVSKNGRTTKFINYKYYTNRLSVVTVKRKNLPRLPPKIRENIARKVNKPPKPKTEANKMNVAHSTLRAYRNKQKVLSHRFYNTLRKKVPESKRKKYVRNLNNNTKVLLQQLYENVGHKLYKRPAIYKSN